VGAKGKKQVSGMNVAIGMAKIKRNERKKKDLCIYLS
jgi:hypothetical protein